MIDLTDNFYKLEDLLVLVSNFYVYCHTLIKTVFVNDQNWSEFEYPASSAAKTTVNASV